MNTWTEAFLQGEDWGLRLSQASKKCRSDFSVEVVSGVIVIKDFNRGRMSVTNDIENVLAYTKIFLEQEINWKKSCSDKIIYLDSEGIWDGIFVNENFEFMQFYMIRAEFFNAALKAAVSSAAYYKERT